MPRDSFTYKLVFIYDAQVKIKETIPAYILGSISSK
jgi:hypothetical protein